MPEAVQVLNRPTLEGNVSSPRTPAPTNPIRLRRDERNQPAVYLPTLTSDEPNLASTTVPTHEALTEHNLGGLRAHVVVLLEHTPRMFAYTGQVRALLGRALGVGLAVDNRASIDVIPYDQRVYPTVRVDADNYQRIDHDLWHEDEAREPVDAQRAWQALEELAAKTNDLIIAIHFTTEQPSEFDYGAVDERLEMLPVLYATMVVGQGDFDPAQVSGTDFARAVVGGIDRRLLVAKQSGVITE